MNNVQCSACGTEAYPSIMLNQNLAMVPSCPKCGTEHHNVSMDDTPPAETKLAKVLPIRAPQPSSEPTDVIAMIQARIQFLDIELAKCAGYAAERKKLARMLGRAEKP